MGMVWERSAKLGGMYSNFEVKCVLTCAMALPMFGLRAQTQLLERDTVTFFRSKDVQDAGRDRQNLELNRSDSTYLWFNGTPSQFKTGSDNAGSFVIHGDVIRLFRASGDVFQTYRYSRKCVLPLPDACTYEERLVPASLFGRSLHRKRMISVW